VAVAELASVTNAKK